MISERTQQFSTKEANDSQVLENKYDNPERYFHKSTIMEMPVEKLCSGCYRVLERFETVDAARGSVSTSKHHHPFYLALMGRNVRNSRMYMGFFWKLQRSSHLSNSTPKSASNCGCYARLVGTGRSQPSAEPTATESNTAGPEHNLAPLSKLMEMPVERLCLTTGKVLERFETAEAARKSITHPTSQEMFERVLRSDNPYHPRTYNGFLWRLKGSSHLPPRLPKPQDGTVTKPPAPVEKRRLETSGDGSPTKRSKPDC
jgi:hypothetical protein